MGQSGVSVERLADALRAFYAVAVEAAGWSPDWRSDAERILERAVDADEDLTLSRGQSGATDLTTLLVAHGGYTASSDRRMMYVSKQIVEQCQEWSQAVRFKFVECEDGTVEMWLQIAGMGE